MSTFNQSAIYPRVFPEIPREARPISHWPTLPPPPRGAPARRLLIQNEGASQPSMQLQVEPFLLPADTSPPK